MTPSGLYSYKVQLFGLHKALVIYSGFWEDHLQAMMANAWASLTVNQAKHEFAKATVTYLGKVVGQGQVRPVRAIGVSN